MLITSSIMIIDQYNFRKFSFLNFFGKFRIQSFLKKIPETLMSKKIFIKGITISTDAPTSDRILSKFYLKFSTRKNSIRGTNVQKFLNCTQNYSFYMFLILFNKYNFIQIIEKKFPVRRIVVNTRVHVIIHPHRNP